MEMYQLGQVPPLSEIAIVVARKRRWWTIIFFVPIYIVFFLLGQVYLFVMLVSSAFSDIFIYHTFDLSSQVLYIPEFILVILCIFGSGWIFWSTFVRPFFARGPILVTNREGIQIGKIPGFVVPGGDFVPWESIEAVGLDRSGTSLTLSLKDSREYVSQFGFGRRLAMRINLMLHDRAFCISQIHMKQSATHVFQQLSQAGAYELNSFGVKLEKSHTSKKHS